MTKQTYTTRAGITQFRPVMTETEYRHEQEECVGFCLACGETTDSGVEPDARRRHCESCGQPKVYGLEELLLMNLVVIEDTLREHPLRGVLASIHSDDDR